jgi:hypothetical protein
MRSDLPAAVLVIDGKRDRSLEQYILANGVRAGHNLRKP